MRNLTNFDSSTQKSQKSTLLWAPFDKSMKCLSYKSTEKLSFMTLMSDAKFEEKLNCDLENDMRNLANFHQSTQKSQNWDFDRILQSKVEKTSA